MSTPYMFLLTESPEWTCGDNDTVNLLAIVIFVDEFLSF